MASIRSSKLPHHIIGSGKHTNSQQPAEVAKSQTLQLKADIPTENKVEFSLKWDKSEEYESSPFDSVRFVKEYLEQAPGFMEIGNFKQLELELRGEARFKDTEKDSVVIDMFNGENYAQKLAYMTQDLLNALQPKHMPETTKWHIDEDSPTILVPENVGVGPSIIRLIYVPPTVEEEASIDEVWDFAKNLAQKAQEQMRSDEDDSAVAPAAVINTSYPTVLDKKYVLTFTITGIPDSNFVLCATIFGRLFSESPLEIDKAGSQVSFQVEDGTLTTANIIPGTVEYNALADIQPEVNTNGF